MLIDQTPADWWALVGPINQTWEALETVGGQLGILTNYVDVLEKRVKELENARVSSLNSEKAREAIKKKGHWVTKAKKDLDTLKESRKKQGLSTKTNLKGLKLYREITQYMKLHDQPDEAKKVLAKIFYYTDGN